MSKLRGLAAFVLGALFAGALFYLAVQFQLVMLDVPLLLAAAFAGAFIGLLMTWGVRRRRSPRRQPAPALVPSQDEGQLRQAAVPSPVLAVPQASQPATPSLVVGTLSPDGTRFWNGAQWEKVE